MTAAAAPRTALLVGATGLIGRALLALLVTRYAHVTVLARRERPADVAPGPRLTWLQGGIDAATASLPSVDDVYIALGTTLAAAGSEAAFRRVDQDAVVALAQGARARGATRLAVVSALGADRTSRVFYNRVKGEMEAAIAGLGYASVSVARPSLLLGDRAALGQPRRRGEAWAAAVARALAPVVPGRWRPIEAPRVARALAASLLEGRPGVRVLSSADMQDAIGAA